jgi:Flp pilus assembly protein TadG
VLELAVVMPAVLLLLAVMAGAGRLWATKASVLDVAREAGRAAVEAPDAAAAASEAQQAAADRAGAYRLDPARLSVEPAGTLERGSVYTVTVRYEVDLADLPGLGFLPASVTLRARHVEPVDLYPAR